MVVVNKDVLSWVESFNTTDHWIAMPFYEKSREIYSVTIRRNFGADAVINVWNDGTVLITANGAISFSEDEFRDLYQAVDEARAKIARSKLDKERQFPRTGYINPTA